MASAADSTDAPSTTGASEPSRAALPALLWPALLLGVATFAVYSPVFYQQLTSWDDTAYITENPYVLGGITGKGVDWAFRTTHQANYHPLTWISLMLDAELTGKRAWGFKLHNLLHHVASSLLLLLILHQATGRPWRAFFVAALFALHPLHVESVAWASERKDTLSTLWALVACWAYLRYARSSRRWDMTMVLAALGLSLLAKQMYVTLPLVLLLLDFWPLRRLRREGEESEFSRVTLVGAVTEKLPLLFFCVVAAVGIYLLQGQQRESVQHIDWPPIVRLGNAAVAAAIYLRQTFWPVDLAFFQPYPQGGYTLQTMAGAGGIIAALTLAAIFLRNLLPYVFVGWMWYIITLLPVSGVVQVGWHAYADRYTYFPLIGIFLALVWLVADLAARRPQEQPIIAGIGATLLVVLSGLSWQQVRTWDSSETLARHALAVNEANDVAHSTLGGLCFRRSERDEAEAHYRRALELNDRQSTNHLNLGMVLLCDGKVDEARVQFARAQEIFPGEWHSLYHLGTLALSDGELDKAQELLLASLKASPTNIGTKFSLAITEARRGDLEASRAILEDLIGRGTSTEIRLARELVEKMAKGDADAKWRFQQAFDWPATATASRLVANNAFPFYESGRMTAEQAIAELDRALELWPNNIDALLHRAIILGRSNQTAEARKMLDRVRQLDPNNETLKQIIRPRGS